MENVVGLHYTAPNVGNTWIRIGVGLTNCVTDIHEYRNEMITFIPLLLSILIEIHLVLYPC